MTKHSAQRQAHRQVGEYASKRTSRWRLHGRIDTGFFGAGSKEATKDASLWLGRQRWCIAVHSRHGGIHCGHGVIHSGDGDFYRGILDVASGHGDICTGHGGVCKKHSCRPHNIERS
jgi:hypothetical protein